MARAGPRKVKAYSLAFKRAAVELSKRPGVQVQTVAQSLDIHPFMLSKLRKEFREGRMRAVPALRKPTVPLREVRCLQALEHEHAQLQVEHDLLKRAIRFCSVRRPTSSPSSTRNGRS